MQTAFELQLIFMKPFKVSEHTESEVASMIGIMFLSDKGVF